VIACLASSLSRFPMEIAN